MKFRELIIVGLFLLIISGCSSEPLNLFATSTETPTETPPIVDTMTPTPTETAAPTATATREPSKTPEPTETEAPRVRSCFDEAAIKGMTDRFMEGRPEAGLDEAVSNILKEAGVDEGKQLIFPHIDDLSSADLVNKLIVSHAVLLGQFTVEDIQGTDLTVRCPVFGVGQGVVLSGLWNGFDRNGKSMWVGFSEFFAPGDPLPDLWVDENGTQTFETAGQRLDELVGQPLQVSFLIGRNFSDPSGKYHYYIDEDFVLSPLVRGSFADRSPGNGNAIMMPFESNELLYPAGVKAFFERIRDTKAAGVLIDSILWY